MIKRLLRIYLPAGVLAFVLAIIVKVTFNWIFRTHEADSTLVVDSTYMAVGILALSWLLRNLGIDKPPRRKQ